MKRVKGSYLLITFLLGVVTWAWLVKVDGFGKRSDILKGVLKIQTQKASEFKKAIPVMVEEVKPPIRIRKEIPKKKTYKKSRAGKNTNAGKGKSKPNLLARYEMPVDEYLKYMTLRGAKVLVYDKLTDRFVCEVLNNGILMKSSGIKEVSNHLRRLTDDFPQGEEILTKVDKHFGKGNYEILLLVPDHIDRSFTENISRIVNEKGLDMKDIVTVFMTYKGNSFTLLVYVEKVAGSFGTVKIGEYFRL